MLKALIFDFDGLMIDTEYTWYPIYQEYLKEHHDYTIKMEEFLTCIGSDDTHFMNLVRSSIGETFDEAHFNEVKTRLFLEQSMTLPMMDGVHDLILEAKQHNIKLAIATSSKHPHALTHLKRWGIEGLFDMIITADDVEFIKPAPDLFIKAIKKLNLEPNEAFILEDSYNGLRAANKAGIECIIVPNKITIHSDFKTERLKIDSLKDVTIDFLKELKNENY